MLCRHYITTATGQRYEYRKLCICTGSFPKLINFESKHIVGLRDTDSAIELKKKLEHAKRVCIVGNGGIAIELIHELKNIDIVWVVRHKYAASTFVDSGAAEFLLGCEKSNNETDRPAQTWRYTVAAMAAEPKKSDVHGCALGPNWHDQLDLRGALSDKRVTLECQSEIKDICDFKPANAPDEDSWPVYVTLENGKVFGCDLVVSATGVSPSVPQLEVRTTIEIV